VIASDTDHASIYREADESITQHGNAAASSTAGGRKSKKRKLDTFADKESE
jgi:hypothetical protein